MAPVVWMYVWFYLELLSKMHLIESWMAWNFVMRRLWDAVAVGVKRTKRDYLSCVTQRIGLKMSLSSGTHLSVLSGVLRRLPTMLCCSVATPSVGVKFVHKTRVAAYYSQACPYVPFTKSDGQHRCIYWLRLGCCLFILMSDCEANGVMLINKDKKIAGMKEEVIAALALLLAITKYTYNDTAFLLWAFVP